jgi:hypothetical protein
MQASSDGTTKGQDRRHCCADATGRLQCKIGPHGAGVAESARDEAAERVAAAVAGRGTLKPKTVGKVSVSKIA